MCAEESSGFHNVYNHSPAGVKSVGNRRISHAFVLRLCRRARADVSLKQRRSEKFSMPKNTGAQSRRANVSLKKGSCRALYGSSLVF